MRGDIFDFQLEVHRISPLSEITYMTSSKFYGPDFLDLRTASSNLIGKTTILFSYSIFARYQILWLHFILDPITLNRIFRQYNDNLVSEVNSS